MHVSHGLCTAVTLENSTTSIQNVCGLFWASIGKTWSLTQKCSHEQASLSFTLYCRKLKWDGQATWHGCLMTACQNSSYMVSSATENDHLLGKRNASRTPLRRPSQAWSKNSRNNQDRGGSEKACCSQSKNLLYHQHFSRPDISMPRVWKSAAGPNWTD